MVVLNYTGGEVNAKIVYYGPGLSGKTTNLEYIHDRTPAGSRGKMVSMKTQTDRTLFFDFLPLELGEINGYRTRFLLYTVPGQVYYNATRKLVLKGVDAVVFVGDSSRAKLDENLESLRNLEQNLNEHGTSLDELPWVIQYNKRDTPDAMAIRDLDARLNPLRVPSFEAVATAGKGVYETFHGIATLVYRVLKERLERGDLGDPAPAVVADAVKPTRRDAAPAPAGGESEFEFDTAIDSMLREVDAPSRIQRVPVAEAPRNVAPPPAPSPRPGKERRPEPAVASRPAPAEHPARAASPSAPWAGANQPATALPHRRDEAAAPSTPAGTTPAGAPRRSETPRADDGLFESIPSGAFDLELGRLPALDDASVASDEARDQGPSEFVTDPMRRPVTPKAAPAPAPAATTAPSPVATVAPRELDSPAEFSVTVPVVLTRAQIRAGVPVRVLLDVRIRDE